MQIPGVTVQVNADAIPKQLAPSGVLGLVGFVEHEGAPTGRAASWSSFVDQFGPGSAHSLPQAIQALQNGVYELVVAPVSSSEGAPATATIAVSGKAAFTLTARTHGPWANEIAVELRASRNPSRFDLIVGPKGDPLEVHRGLDVLVGSPQYLPTVLAERSSILRVDADAVGAKKYTSGTKLAPGASHALLLADGAAEVLSLDIDEDGPQALTIASDPKKGTFSITDMSDPDAPVIVVQAVAQPFPGEQLTAWVRATPGTRLVQPEVTMWSTTPLSGGEDAPAAAYKRALDTLEDHGDVDLVIAAVQDREASVRAQVYSNVIAHCVRLSADCKGRVGLGSVPPAGDLTAHEQLASSLVSDRFALIAPAGVEGAVAGRLGSLPYHHSPTFKRLAGLGAMRTALTLEQQRKYLDAGVIPVAVYAGRGAIVVKGHTTDLEQLSVRRVADRAVRGVRMVGDLFVGRLNNEDSRAALKQKAVELLTQMERQGALVPSTDGAEPAFQVRVHASQLDFQQGRVNLDIWVRPVRAIDYVAATIVVQG